MDDLIYNAQEMRKKMFAFLYGCAMHDAILQKAFDATEKKWIGEVEAPIQYVQEYVDMVLSNRFISPEEHDSYFLRLANRICSAINEEGEKRNITIAFSFGNAQKLINMTIKFVYGFCYHDGSLRQGFRFCHCPLDSFMLKAVWERAEKHCGGQGKRRDRLGTAAEFHKAWGNEGAEMNPQSQPELTAFPPRYHQFQTIIREMCQPSDLYSIEYDYMDWKAKENTKGKK